MTTSAQELEDLLEEIDQTPRGPEERELVRRAVELAEASGDDVGLYRARLRQVSSAFGADDHDTALSVFTWCVAKSDEDPDRFPARGGADENLLWYFKWMTELLGTNTRFPRAQADEVAADMEQRYTRAGVGLSGVWQARFDLAQCFGDLDEAARLQAVRRATPRDDYSHCEACTRAADADFAALLGDDTEAVRLWREIREQDLVCAEEPEASDAHALLPLLRLGEYDAARATHLRGYREAQRLEANADIVAHHLVFLGVTGNLSRGLSLLERHLPGLAAVTVDERARMNRLSAAGVLLDALRDGGLGDVPVRGTDTGEVARLLEIEHDDPAERLTVAEFAEYAWSTATDLARRFDERNGNDTIGQGVAARKALRDARVDLPLEAGTSSVPAVTGTAARPPADAEGNARLARLLSSAQAPTHRTVAAVRTGLETADGALATRLRYTLVSVAVSEGGDQAAEEHADFVTVLRASGQEEYADVEERLGLALHRPELSPTERAAVRFELEAARLRDGDPVVHADLATTLAVALLGDGEPDTEGALALLDEAERILPEAEHGLAASIRLARLNALAGAGRLEELAEQCDAILAAETVDSPTLYALDLRARIHAQDGEYEQGLANAERLLAEHLALDAPAAEASAVLSSRLLADLDRVGEAIARVELALRFAERAEHPTEELRLWLARLQLRVGDAELALENAELAYRARAEASPLELADAALVLGEAAFAADEPSIAYGAWGEAVRLSEEEQPAMASDAGISLGRLLARFTDDDNPETIEALERAVANARRAGHDGLLVNALHLLGQARGLRGDRAALGDLDEAASMAQREGWQWLAADVRDSRGRALLQLGELEAGVAELSAAADDLAAAEDSFNGAFSIATAAQALRGAERNTAAVACFESALERLRSADPQHPAIPAVIGDLADALTAAGRSADADRLRASLPE